VFGQKRGNAGVFYRRAALSLFAGKSHLKKHPSAQEHWSAFYDSIRLIRRGGNPFFDVKKESDGQISI